MANATKQLKREDLTDAEWERFGQVCQAIRRLKRKLRDKQR